MLVYERSDPVRRKSTHEGKARFFRTDAGTRFFRWLRGTRSRARGVSGGLGQQQRHSSQSDRQKGKAREYECCRITDAQMR